MQIFGRTGNRNTVLTVEQKWRAKVKQTREEIDTDVRITVKHFTNTDAVIDYVLDSIDELIEEEEE